MPEKLPRPDVAQRKGGEIEVLRYLQVTHTTNSFCIRYRGVMIPFFAGIGIIDIRFWNGFQYSKKIDFCLNRNWNQNQKFLKNEENPIQTPIPESES